MMAGGPEWLEEAYQIGRTLDAAAGLAGLAAGGYLLYSEGSERISDYRENLDDLLED